MKTPFVKWGVVGKSSIVVLGSHPSIVQSILDFDYLCGKENGSVKAIVSVGRRYEKYFWGKQEMLIPCYKSISQIPKGLENETLFALNMQSGRRATQSTREFFTRFPHAVGAHLFAENVPEIDAITLGRDLGTEKLVIGPSGVGLIVPGILKLGAIGGTDAIQLLRNKLWVRGNTAVISASGGMTNEIITSLAQAGRHVAFAVAIGGDRFPLTSPSDAFIAAQQDPTVTHIVYFGELGGLDEYELVALLKEKVVTKPVIAYIAGIADEAFGNHIQFGHAKALVAEPDESARAKREALKNAGALVAESFEAFLASFEIIPMTTTTYSSQNSDELLHRNKTLFTAREIDNIELQGTPSSFITIALSALLGRKVKSKVLSEFTDMIFGLLIDHGPHVSGAVNTMITARAGKDLVDSLCAGLLTIGLRFGGAMNAAANTWWSGVQGSESARDFVDRMNREHALIPGIGHKKYRLGLPDPRVAMIETFVDKLDKHTAWNFAKSVAQVTTQKRGNLILNIDGAVAAILLDILREKEHCTDVDIENLISSEFFNTFFIIPRTIGFLAYALQQKHYDEGLFRMPEDFIYIDKK